MLTGSALQSVASAAGDGDARVRAVALCALWQLGVDARPVLHAIESALDDGDPIVRRWAFAARSRIAAPHAWRPPPLLEAMPELLPWLVQALGDQRSPSGAEVAAHAIASFGPAGLPALPFVLAEWRSSDHEFRDGHAVSERAIRQLAASGDGPRRGLRGRTLAGLGPAARPFLLLALTNEPAVSRQRIVAGLVHSSCEHLRRVITSSLPAIGALR